MSKSKSLAPIEVQDHLESEQFLLRIFDSFADPLAVYDRDFRFVKVNEALLKFYQRSFEDLAGKHCYEVFHNRDAICDECHVQKVLQTGVSQRREMFVKLPDGVRRYFDTGMANCRHVQDIDIFNWGPMKGHGPRTCIIK